MQVPPLFVRSDKNVSICPNKFTNCTKRSKFLFIFSSFSNSTCSFLICFLKVSIKLNLSLLLILFLTFKSSAFRPNNNKAFVVTINQNYNKKKTILIRAKQEKKLLLTVKQVVNIFLERLLRSNKINTANCAVAAYFFYCVILLYLPFFFTLLFVFLITKCSLMKITNSCYPKTIKTPLSHTKIAITQHETIIRALNTLKIRQR